MILQYTDFFKSWENFLQIRPDMMLKIIEEDFVSIIKENLDLYLKINNNILILKGNRTKLKTKDLLHFIEDNENIYYYFIYNGVLDTNDFNLLASKIKLDVKSDHYTNEYNRIKDVSFKETIRLIEK